ncbi:MAG: hypothetical protein IPJ66_17310 [Bacteroidetes bacterium]|nr:hypothetical protein [Bacteroidota bacterium]
MFTAQLSDASGNFSNPVNIGTLAGTSSGTISAAIPLNANTGSGYRIRVLSNSPEVTSFDNGVNLSIEANPFVTITGTTGLCEGAPANPVANPSGCTYSWNTGETSQSITVTQAGTFSVTVTNGTGCTSSASVAIQQASNPQPVISFYPSLTVCQGSYISLYCPGYSSYQWSNGSTTQATSIATAEHTLLQ